ncbi:hypothetical protein PTSG_04200 [Salpingoeca rosetta]|uniref:Uncharacterized protein n=1 Tax=Salpingoeca rosetta (strain ATCC 50818 / BSB-021) TaxID=946362 RepID=F2U6W0_SALR5|nr:uncharacterized protein PTSG_04200 [Salpingoeca rosetta]EGD83592.1 hypothetical protein PTSG_04200 [Salpingoeca rosetta]|eukprot:XP_004995096.1 hypothetical protein PTSG_04200 [Salpingoeca rosetta]
MTSETHKKSCPASAVYLLIINSLYLLLGIMVIAVVATAQGKVNVNLPAFGGIIAAWSLLVFVAFLGLYGTFGNKPGILFAYMILLGLLFLIQFSSSIAALSISSSQQQSLLESAWCGSSNATKGEIQRHGDCLGFYTNTTGINSCYGPVLEPEYCPRGCVTAQCTPDKPAKKAPTDQCEGCFDKLKPNLQRVLNTGGGVGLTFAFTMFVGIWAAWSHRRAKRAPATYREFL